MDGSTAALCPRYLVLHDLFFRFSVSCLATDGIRVLTHAEIDAVSNALAAIDRDIMDERVFDRWIVQVLTDR